MDDLRFTPDAALATGPLPRSAEGREARGGAGGDARGDDRLITGARTPGEVTRDVCAPLERGPTAAWYAAFAAALAALLLGVACVAYQVRVGIGTWGLNRTVGWAFDITNFVFWIGSTFTVMLPYHPA